MSNVWGDNIRLTIFGESHGKGVGITIDGLPSGIELDMDSIRYEMARRAPGKSKLATQRNEKDAVDIISGYFNGYTTGTPLCGIIYNEDKRSKDYSKIKDVMRPGHGDYTGHIKYKGFNDYRGGGHFSGRLTAPIVFAGAIAKQILAAKNIMILSHIKSIGKIEEKSFLDSNIDDDLINRLRKQELPTIDFEMEERFKEIILMAKEEADSVGGQIEVAILNCPPGLGDPFFDSLESTISRLVFSVPSVKGIEFGRGFDITKMMGSESNDCYRIEAGEITTDTNNNGGILGGITNGMPIIFNTAIKPTPSIGKEQRTINIEEKKETSLMIEGRHDPCIVPRAVPVIEAVAALSVLDYVLNERG